MFNIIERSKQRALIRQNWFNGEQGWQIGQPFRWIDGDLAEFKSRAEGKVALLSFLTANNGGFKTPKDFMVNNFDEILEDLKKRMENVFIANLPFFSIDNFIDRIKGLAHVRTQDYSFIKTYCVDLPTRPNHVDLGPGVGSHSLYSLYHLNATYYALEAATPSYVAQKDFLFHISGADGSYFDVIDAEHLECSFQKIKDNINVKTKYKVKHIPSWYFGEIDDLSIDLVSATWMLNEVSYSDIFWLMSNAIRVLKKGGYFYVRDSEKLKPHGHSVQYDQLLQKLGFKLINRADVKNLIDYYGVPRVYEKTDDSVYTWEDLVKICVPKHVSVATGGGNETGLTDKTFVAT